MKKALFSRNQEQTSQEGEILEGLNQRMLKNQRSTCLFSELMRRRSGTSKKYWDWSAEKTGGHTIKSSKRTIVPKQKQREGE